MGKEQLTELPGVPASEIAEVCAATGYYARPSKHGELYLIRALSFKSRFPCFHLKIGVTADGGEMTASLYLDIRERTAIFGGDERVEQELKRIIENLEKTKRPSGLKTGLLAKLKDQSLFGSSRKMKKRSLEFGHPAERIPRKAKHRPMRGPAKTRLLRKRGRCNKRGEEWD